MTPKSPTLIEQIDAHYNGGLIKWKKRYQTLLNQDRHSEKALHIAASQLFESYQSGRHDALVILDKVIACTSSRPCFQILCPACRVKRQNDTATKAVAAFSIYPGNEIKFMTLLMQVETDASKLHPAMKAFRKAFKNQLRNNAAALGTAKLGFKMIGAFEIDVKNMATQSDASFRSQELIKQLGYTKKYGWKCSYLPHLHAIVGPLDDVRQDELKVLIGKSLGKSLVPYQLHFKSLHTTKPNSQDENLRNLASYMFKARLQYADNIFDNNVMQKRSRYHTPFKGKILIDYLNVVDAMGNFKGLKFDFGV